MFALIGAIVRAVGEITGSGLGYGAAVKSSKATKAVADKKVEETKLASETKLKAAQEEVKQEILKSLAVHAQSEKEQDNTGWWVLVIVLLIMAVVAGTIALKPKQ